MRYLKLWLSLIILMILVPSAALAFYKPARVFIPSMFGVTCTQDNICIDDISRIPEALALRAEAVEFVNNRVGAISQAPRIIFCSTEECSSRFGKYQSAAYIVGTYGIVIRRKGWTNYFVRHELIHHLQNERLGSINAYFFKPQWFIEGMAYSLSDDPRRPIKSQVLEDYRAKFERWHDGRDIWARAEGL